MIAWGRWAPGLPAISKISVVSGFPELFRKANVLALKGCMYSKMSTMNAKFLSEFESKNQSTSSISQASMSPPSTALLERHPAVQLAALASESQLFRLY